MDLMHINCRVFHQRCLSIILNVDHCKILMLLLITKHQKEQGAKHCITGNERGTEADSAGGKGEFLLHSSVVVLLTISSIKRSNASNRF